MFLNFMTIFQPIYTSLIHTAAWDVSLTEQQNYGILHHIPKADRSHDILVFLDGYFMEINYIIPYFDEVLTPVSYLHALMDNLMAEPILH